MARSKLARGVLFGNSKQREIKVEHGDEELEGPPDIVRSAQEVARRAIALYCTTGLAYGADRADLLRWLAENDLKTALSPYEAKLFAASALSERETIQVTWYAERLIVLLWALCKIDELPPANEQCNTAIAAKFLPPFADIQVAAFMDGARLRPDIELIEMADKTLNLHWAARDAKFNNRPPPSHVDIGIILERHYAINWVTGYEGLEWDMVTADT
jgi:hypothetical protein